jgi:hypothetical protein
VVLSLDAGPVRKGRAKRLNEKTTVSDFLTVVLSLDVGPVRKGRAMRPDEKTTVSDFLTVVLSPRCGTGAERTGKTAG